MSSTSPSTLRATASPLTSLLSQYELLTTLCENLSSADIVHLGATSKEHWQYIGHNSIIFKSLIADSECDGKGIIAQARVFGYWQADPSKATRKCQGKDAKSCGDCGAMVCNNCRYHIEYSTFDAREDPDLWDFVEEEIAYGVRDAEIEEENVTHVVELKKTIRMLSDKDLTHCQDCEPLFIDTPGSRGWCTCNLHSHFVKPWRCIPCVLAEEAQIVTSQQDYLMSYDPGQPRKWVYSKTLLCGCGKVEVEQSTETCRWCRGVTGYCYGRDVHHLRRIHEQLGSATGPERIHDPILSQLG